MASTESIGCFSSRRTLQINPEAENAILDAELVIVGPGSLYTSILPNLLIDGMVEALRASPAVKVYVCNIASQPGETMGYTVSEHLTTIEDHVGDHLFDYVIVNSNVGLPLPRLSDRGGGHARIGFDRAQAAHQPVNYVLADVVIGVDLHRIMTPRSSPG